MTTTVPITDTTAHYYDGWAKRVHELLSRERLFVRLSEQGLAIETKSVNTGQWMAIMLPTGGTQFASAEDRQLLYEMVTGMREIPEAAPV